MSKLVDDDDDGAADEVPLLDLKLTSQPNYSRLMNPVIGSEMDEAQRANAQFNSQREGREFGSRIQDTET